MILLVVRSRDTLAKVSKRSSNTWWWSTSNAPRDAISIDQRSEQRQETSEKWSHTNNLLSGVDELLSGSISIVRNEVVVGESVQAGAGSTEIVRAWSNVLVATTLGDVDVLSLSVECVQRLEEGGCGVCSLLTLHQLESTGCDLRVVGNSLSHEGSWESCSEGGDGAQEGRGCNELHLGKYVRIDGG